MTGLNDILKRGLDLLVAGFALAASVPVWIVIASAILLEDGWPILYPQLRVGQGGRVFTAYKFRSMIRDAEKDLEPRLADVNDPRITRAGRILRKTALDEMPQLINIFKGDMSWVGPRPERPEFVRRFLREIPGYHLRHQVRPGLTGAAQVYGRYHTEAAQKLRYDLYYLRHRGLWLDLRLFLMSWRITFRARWDSTAVQR
jgi:lipopolysaccharide/colanic/teichoic acid biosynthesis glycosyltransferase